MAAEFNGREIPIRDAQDKLTAVNRLMACVPMIG